MTGSLLIEVSTLSLGSELTYKMRLYSDQTAQGLGVYEAISQPQKAISVLNIHPAQGKISMVKREPFLQKVC